MHDFFAPQRGQGADAEVELLLASAEVHLQHDAAVLRQALFADVELGHDLHARGDGVLQLERRRHDALQHAVNTEAHAEFFFVGLDVNVAGAALHRIGQDQVDQLDDGRFVGRSFQIGQLHLFFFGLQFDVGFVHLRHRLHDLLEVFLLGGAVGLLDAFENRAFRGHHRLNVEAGHELDIVHGEDVGGIDHGDGQRSADAAQRQNLVTLGSFERNQLDDRGIDFKIGKIDGGNAVLPGEKVGDVLVGEEAQLDQGRAQATVALFLDLGRLLQLLWGDDLLFDEKITQPLRHTSISYLRDR